MTTTYNFNGYIQTVTVGTSGTYHITVNGASGGHGGSGYYGGGGTGGLGATVSGNVYLQAGSEIQIVVGGQGRDSLPYSNAGGGGGGSFVIEILNETHEYEFIAGGGGGGGYVSGNGGNGLTSASSAGAPSGGAGGGGDENGGGGGGGFSGGGGGPSRPGGPGSTSESFTGGGGAYGGGAGGFGGGGGGGGNGGGGGGGYNGGVGGYGDGFVMSGGGGGGGTSYVNPTATNVAELSGANTGFGLVTIDLISAAEFAPVVATTAGTTMAPKQVSVAVDAGLTLSDADDSHLASATVAITSGYRSGEDVLGFTANTALYGNLVGTFDSTAGVLTLTTAGGTVTTEQFQAALRSVTYRDTLGTPNTGDREISFTANDISSGSTVASKTVNVTLATLEAPSLIVTTLNDVVDAFDNQTSLREALAYANSHANANASTPDVITFEAGLTGTVRLTGGTLVITDAVTVDGDKRITISGDVNGDDTTVAGTDITDLAATQSPRLNDNVQLIDAAANLALKGVTLTGGSGGDSRVIFGGAVHVADEATLAIEDSTITGNDAYRGGGIHGGTGSTITLTNSTISDNTSQDDGGGIFGDTSAHITVTGSTISRNTSQQESGGGIAVGENGAIELIASTISQNESSYYGGGIFAEDNSSIVLTGSTVSGNRASSGGGGIAGSSQVSISLTNATVSGNTAGDDGGGISGGSGSQITLTNSTITGNFAGERGGGIDAGESHPGAPAVTTLVNSIVAGNAATDQGQDLYGDNEGSTLTFVGGNIIGSQPVDFGPVDGLASAVVIDGASQAELQKVFASVVKIDPNGGAEFFAGALADNGGPVQTVALNASATNPALDASDDSAPASDARGQSALDVAGVDNNGAATSLRDLGAYELTGPVAEAPSLVVTTLTDVVDAFDGKTSLREAIAYANTHANTNASTPDVITFASNLSGTIRLDGGDGAGGVVGGTLVVTDALRIDGVGRITISGDVADNDATRAGTDVTDLADTSTANLSDNVQLINATASLALKGLTLTGGQKINGDSRGGAVFAANGTTLAIDDSTISGNKAYLGGGIYGGADSTVTLTSSTVSGNSADNFGGGVAGDDGSSIELIASTVSDNDAYLGAGIHGGNEASIRLTGSTVSGNSAGNVGGGIKADNNSTIALINSTVSGNSSDNVAGGIYGADAATITLTNSTMTGNHARIGGGIDGSGDDTEINLANSIVAGNSAEIGDDLNGSAQSNPLTFTGGNILGSAPTGFSPGEINGEATVIDGSSEAAMRTVFTDVASNNGSYAGVLADNGGPVQTVKLNASVTNPALDASDNSAPATDARGQSAFDVAGVDNNGAATSLRDLGAYEVTGPVAEAPSVVVTTLTDVVDANDGLTSLREAVAYANSLQGADTITFADGLTGTVRLGATGALSVSEALTIDGDKRITISGDVANDDTTLGSSDITNLAATAASELDDNVRLIDATASLTLDGVALTGGRTGADNDRGGAVRGSGSVTIVDSTVSGNSTAGSSAFGGAVYAGTISIDGSTFSGNRAEGAGGGGLAGNNVTITDSTFTGNSSFSYGGGFTGASITLTNSTLSGNTAGGGGGGGFYAMFADVTNSTITGNTTTGSNFSGGGITIASGSLSLTNSVVLGNAAPNSDYDEIAKASGTDYTGGNIVGRNDGSGADVLSDADDIGDTTAAQVFAGTVNIGGGVLAGVLANNGGPVQTIALKANVANPALDASDDSAPANDARGQSAYDVSGVDNNGAATSLRDLGAYEVTSVPDTTLPTLTLDPVAGDNVINAAEAAGVITVSGTALGAEDGQIVTLALKTPDGSVTITTLTAPVQNGAWSINLTAADGPALPDGVYLGTANVSDAAGNSATEATRTLTIDVTAPSVTINPGAGGDDIINAAEAAATITISGTAPGVEDGQLVTLILKAADGTPLPFPPMTAVVSGGVWSLDLDPALGPVLPDGQYLGAANVSDRAGNPAPEATRLATVDTTAPSVTINPGAGGDDIINAAEAAATITVSGTARGVEDGQLVTLAIKAADGSPLPLPTMTAVVSGGVWSLDLDPALGPVLPDGQYLVTANVSDRAGNPAPEATRLATVDTTAPTVTINAIAGDDVVDTAEGAATITVSGTATGVEDGQLVTLALKAADGSPLPVTVTATVHGGVWSLDLPPGTTPSFPDGQYLVTANAADRSGNPAPEATRTITVDVVENIPPVNLAPVNTVPGAQDIGTNTSAAIAGLAVTDADAGSGSLTTTLSALHGTLTVAAVGGVVVAGSGTATVTLTGTQAQINATLAAANNVVYAGDHDAFGTDTLTMTTSDNGNTGTGGALSDTDHVTINLSPLLTGTAGPDDYTALPGSTRIDAGYGIDTVTFGFKLTDAAITYDGNKVIIDGPSSHTVLTGVETYVFTDGTVDNVDSNRMVDDLFYYAQNHDVWNAHVDADSHYETSGWHERRDPNAFFSTVVYLSANPDVAAAGINPLTHYALGGWQEGRVPSLAFDPVQYLSANPDVAAAHIDPLFHFLVVGASEGRQPFGLDHLVTANGFDYAWYLQKNPDVAAAGVDPFAHFQTTGWKEGRDPNGWFDTAGYLATYADVKDAGVNPLDHYNYAGWHEGRDPSVGFDTNAYLAANPDVKDAAINPLLHFLQFGIEQGRSAQADGVWG